MTMRGKIAVEQLKTGEYRVSIKIKDRSILEEWFKRNGMGDYLKRSPILWLYTKEDGELDMVMWEDGSLRTS